MAESFRCAIEATARGDALAGSASTVRAFLLVEHPGPWGVDALRDARLPAGLGEHLAAASRRTGVRVLLVRRPGRARRDRVRVLAAHTGGREPGDAWLEATEVDDLAACTDLDLAAIGAGRPPGWRRLERPLLAVCTHGRHDACCAERGRPVAASLAESHPDDTWEVSHVGGDRFAANLLVLPHGLYYGRVDGESARLVADAAADGRVLTDLLRGRSSLPMPVQAAEVALRRELGEDRLAAVVWRGHRREGDTVTAAFDVAGASYAVVLDVGRGEAARLTCRAAGASVPWLFTVRAIRREDL